MSNLADRLRTLREKRGTAVAAMRAIVEAAETAKRDLTKEELTQHETIFAEQDGLRAQIETLERQADADRALARQTDDAERARAAATGAAASPAELQMEGFRAWLQMRQASPAATAAFRALSSDSDPQGGYLVAPQQFVERLIKFVDDLVFIRGLATKFTVASAKSLGAPSLEADPADADWTAELATGSEDSTMSFGKRELTPYPLAKRIKVSKKLLRNAAMAPDQLVIQRLGYKFAITQEKAFLTGSGAAQPLGIFTASADGVPTSRDVLTGSATDFTMDGIISAKYSLKAQYWAKAQWLFHRDGISKIAKLKDTTNQYLWQPSTQAGQPDRLHGLPLMMSEYVPNTFTTGLYVGMLADFSWYWIADALDMTVQRLLELYAETNQDGFIGRAETDGMPVLAEAFVRLKTS